MKKVFIYQPIKLYGTDFSNAAWAEIMNCQIAEPILSDGKTFNSYMGKIWMKNYMRGKESHLIGSYYKANILPNNYTTKIQILDSSCIEQNDIRNFDMIIIAGFWFYYKYILFLRSNFPNKIIVVVEEDTFDDMMFYDNALQITSINVLRSINLYFAYDRPTFKYVSSLNYSCFFFPLPLNPLYINKLKRNTKFFNKICLGVGHFVSDLSNFVTSILAFRKISENIILYPEIIGVHKFKEGEIKEYRKIIPTLIIKSWVGKDFPRFISQYLLILQPTLRRSFGRLSAESAMVGVPCISNSACYMQKYCWPELSVEPYDQNKIASLLEQLIENKSFYQKVTKIAWRKITGYADNWNICRKKIAKLIHNL